MRSKRELCRSKIKEIDVLWDPSLEKKIEIE